MKTTAMVAHFNLDVVAAVNFNLLQNETPERKIRAFPLPQYGSLRLCGSTQ
jgi:hypothetical protein